METFVTFPRVLWTIALAGLLFPALPAAHGQQRQLLAAPNAGAEDISDKEKSMVREIRADVVAEQFDDIDRLADELRHSKARWAGGDFKLRSLYKALDDPRLTDKDTADHLEHLRHWMTERPESITARIALATSLHRWAWVARGSGTADTVTAEGWRLFGERIKESQTVLDSARDMKVMDPQWYSEEMTVGLAQGWDGRKMKDLFDRAVQFARSGGIFT